MKRLYSTVMVYEIGMENIGRDNEHRKQNQQNKKKNGSKVLSSTFIRIYMEAYAFTICDTIVISRIVVAFSHYTMAWPFVAFIPLSVPMRRPRLRFIFAVISSTYLLLSAKHGKCVSKYVDCCGVVVDFRSIRTYISCSMPIFFLATSSIWALPPKLDCRSSCQTFPIDCHLDGNMIWVTAGLYDILTWLSGRQRMPTIFAFNASGKFCLSLSRVYTHSVNISSSNIGRKSMWIRC